MLAIELGKLDVASWLSARSDLGILNLSSGLTAPELAAKCQMDKSVAIFRVIVENIAFDLQSGRDLMGRTLRAVYNGHRANITRLKTRKQRQRKHLRGSKSLHYPDFQMLFDAAGKRTHEKLQIICATMGFQEPGMLHLLHKGL